MDHVDPLTCTRACVYLNGLSDPMHKIYRNDDNELLYYNVRCCELNVFNWKYLIDVLDVMFLCQWCWWHEYNASQ
jgi:hypothetical protein